eukprot:2727910-Alexandrium_andersonii.AAC.1
MCIRDRDCGAGAGTSKYGVQPRLQPENAACNLVRPQRAAHPHASAPMTTDAPTCSRAIKHMTTSAP